ncbi:MAG: hypothetical protein JWR07_3712 [Nevskia sp.]|nr:hypothetical protein [Nevskia sp.]
MKSTIHQTLDRWRQALVHEIPLSGLLNRNRTAHKWKSGYRALVLRETLFWRMHDTLKQVMLLAEHHHGLGAQILLRSAIECLALMTYSNQRLAALVEGKLGFFDYLDVNSKLLLGSKDKSTKHEAVNILTVLQKVDQRYQGILPFYNMISETAHPNFHGVCSGYSQVDTATHVTHFSNRWATWWGPHQDNMVENCLEWFEHEYSTVFPGLFERMEAWVTEHDGELEAENQRRAAAGRK